MLRICHDARLIINGTLQPTKLLHFYLEYFGFPFQTITTKIFLLWNKYLIKNKFVRILNLNYVRWNTQDGKYLYSLHIKS